MSLPTDSTAETPPEPELSARMLNEFIYCPRLFYYEYVDGVFVHNADTLGGARVHRRVDGGTGKLPPASADRPTNGEPAPPSDADPLPPSSGLPVETANDSPPTDPGAVAADLAAARGRGEIIHSRSVWLSSLRLNLNAKLDLVESREAATADGRRSATPVDYKKGAPREGEDANEIWDATACSSASRCSFCGKTATIARRASSTTKPPPSARRLAPSGRSTLPGSLADGSPRGLPA